MNPMTTSIKVLTWIYLYPETNQGNKSRKIGYNLFFFSIFTILSSGLASSIACLLKYWSIDLEKSFYSPIQIFTTLSTVFSLLIGFLLRNRILAMFNNLSRIYKMSKKYYRTINSVHFWYNYNLPNQNYLFRRRGREFFVLGWSKS